MKRLAILLVLAITACSAVGGTEAADRAVTQFHSGYDQSRFEPMFSAAHPALKSTTTQQQFVEFMQAVRRKLGKVKSTKRTNYGVNVSTSGTRVTMIYDTQFEQGAGVEQFVWQVRGDSARLIGYNINSPTLIMK